MTTTLIIRLSSVGDIILTSPLIRTLRARFPHCRIDFLVKEEYADLIRHNPHLTQTLLFPSGGTLADLRRLRNRIRTSRYDLIVDVHDSLRSRFVSTGPAPVVRYRKRKFARLVLVSTKRDIYSWFGGAPSVVRRYLEPLKPYGVEDDGLGLEVFVPDSVRKSADRLLQQEGLDLQRTTLGVCPSARHGNKMWLPERFADAAGSIARSSGQAVTLFGDGKERERCSAIADAIGRNAPDVRVFNLAGKLSLLQTAAAMDTCSLVLTNDTGLMHLALSRKRNVVAVFGPTVRQFGFYPESPQARVVETSGLSCRPCTTIGGPTCPRGHFRCMRDIAVDRVTEAADELLNRM